VATPRNPRRRNRRGSRRPSRPRRAPCTSPEISVPGLVVAEKRGR
jgi:hypothetical protein